MKTPLEEAVEIAKKYQAMVHKQDKQIEVLEKIIKALETKYTELEADVIELTELTN